MTTRWTEEQYDAFIDRQSRSRSKLQDGQGGQRAGDHTAHVPPLPSRATADAEGATEHDQNEESSQGVDEQGNGATTLAIRIVVRISDNRRRDLDGALSTILDCLVNAGAIADDSRQIITKETVSFRLVEQGQEGADIEILEDL